MDNDLSFQDMKERWMRLAVQYGAHSVVAEKLFETIVRAYSEPGRHYHTLNHVGDVLDVVQSHRAGPEEGTALRFAAWFHDLIYDTRRVDNEERSADFAANVLHALMVPEGVAKRTVYLIALTKRHDPVPDDSDAQLFIDADLAIFGADADVYRRYSAAIRREYAWVADHHFNAARRRVILEFLARDCIYHTPSMRERLEERACANLRREVEEIPG